MKLYLYLISQDVNTGYDTFDSAVVAAYSMDEARKIRPETVDGWSPSDFYDAWCEPEYVKVKFIGLACNVEPGVVCASFNAG